MTIRSWRCTGTTRPARILHTPQVRHRICMPSNDTLTMEKTQTPAAPRPEPPRPTPTERPAGSPRAKILRVALIGFLIVAGAATAWWMHTRDRVSTDDAQVDGHIDYIAPRVAGSIAEVMVENGTFVK